MRESQVIMGMPITVDVRDGDEARALADTFDYFRRVDEQFSTYKDTSEILRIDRGEITESQWSDEMREVFAIGEATKQATHGYFDIRCPDGHIDPSGVVKGWAIHNASKRLTASGHKDYFIDAGGDVAMSGANAKGEPWSVGIRDPFKKTGIVKALYPRGAGVATSGSYLRGDHIYDPLTGLPPEGLVSITVIGPDVLQADLYATAAFAMGKDGIGFIERLPGFEGYAIDERGMATLTTGFDAYTTI